MLDRWARRIVDPPLDRLAAPLVHRSIPADAVTLAGFTIGLLALPCLAVEAYGAALLLIALNRLADGVDGAVARRVGPTDRGGYLDIVCDFIFYSAVVFGFALARPENAVAAAFLIFSFVGTGTSFLAYAVMAAKHGLTATAHPAKSLFYLGGLTEGTETIALFIALCLFPDAFIPLAYFFGALCWITTASRMLIAWNSFSRG